MKPTTILWADDDTDDLALMHLVLQQLNTSYSIHEVYNGQQALEYLQQAKQSQHLPALIVLDMNMPIKNGRETLVLLKQDDQFRNIPTVIVTTSSSPLDKVFCERYHTPMITKPINVKALTEVMQQLLSLCSIPIKRE